MRCENTTAPGGALVLGGGSWSESLTGNLAPYLQRREKKRKKEEAGGSEERAGKQLLTPSPGGVRCPRLNSESLNPLDFKRPPQDSLERDHEHSISKCHQEHLKVTTAIDSRSAESSWKPSTPHWGGPDDVLARLCGATYFLPPHLL